MRYSTRFIVTAALAAGLVAAALPATSSAYTLEEQKCRAAIAKSGGKFAKTALKTLSNCHKNRDKNGPDTADCNDLAAADTKVKLPAAEEKLETGVNKKCLTGAPSDVSYDTCPAPCNVEVPSITTFSHVAECLACLTEGNSEAYSETANTDPTAPIADDGEAACHKSIVKNGSKVFNAAVKAVSKCQASSEKEGGESITACASTEYLALTQKAYDKAYDSILDACTGVSLPSATLDACGSSSSAFDLALCVVDAARISAQELVVWFLDLSGPVITTTTTTTTTTTMGNTTTTTVPSSADPLCPDLGELVLYSKLSNVACTDNNDCTEPRTCDTSIGICTTVADLDSGWTGLAQDSDINDAVATRARLYCPGPAPTCGQCDVEGIDPGPGNCRCANNVRNICDEPFVADADDCGGAVCNCFFGAPFPLNSAGTHVCVVNRFTEDLTGTANVDLGAGSITAKLRAQVFLGEVDRQPCPFCGGTCSVTTTTECANDAGCPMGETCQLDTPGDGIRDGVCVTGAHDGLSCDAIAYNSSFPAVYSTPAGGSGGGLYSIDCQPDVGKNVSGQGLKIQLDQTTGLSSLDFTLDCDGAGPLSDLCPCKVCSNDTGEPCSSDAHCQALPSTCAGVTNPPAGIISCFDDSDCQNKNAGTCTALSNTRCSLDFGQVCNGNDALCQNLDQGPCSPSFCSAIGAQGVTPEPNDCTGGACSDTGGGEGECTTGPDDKYCDGLVRSDGSGMKACSVNADCTAGLGACTQVDRRDCFLDPIVITGTPDPEFPVAGATFCIPPTSNGGINSVAGLPGPGRVVSQGAARTFCTNDHNVEYQPGIGGCP